MIYYALAPLPRSILQECDNDGELAARTGHWQRDIRSTSEISCPAGDNNSGISNQLCCALSPHKTLAHGKEDNHEHSVEVHTLLEEASDLEV